MSEQLADPEELSQKILKFSKTYHLVDFRRDRALYMQLTPDQLKQYPVCICGVVMNLIMDGELDKAEEYINNHSEEGFLLIQKLGLKLVFPRITWREFLNIIAYLKKNKISLGTVILTVGRPSILNGFNDFTRMGPLLVKQKSIFIENLTYLYETSVCPSIYQVCLAEYYYQLNKVFDAELLVSRTIKEFDKNAERHLLFAALSLQTKILIAHGKIVNSDSYIKNIRNFVEENKTVEFAYNIDAAEVMMAFYDGNCITICDWMKHNAPDEFADFNMLDLYRYMVKIRCYIVEKKYAAVVAIAEKLRPLLEEGRRHMDMCELDILLAISLFRAQKKDLAFEVLERGLQIAKRRGYYRLVGDEGAALLPLLIDYIKEKGESDFLMKILEIVRSMAIYHPLYLNDKLKNNESFSQREIEILKLVEQGKTKEEIADYFFISTNTVKFHLKNIYMKLEANSATQAVWQGRVLGII